MKNSRKDDSELLTQGKSMKTKIKTEDLTMFGELSVREIANYARLEKRGYRPNEVFEADKHGWPADWEGRLILGLTFHYNMTGRKPAYLKEIIDEIPAHLNEKGYFGRICKDGEANEQQLAGHSWYVRGLLEYYKSTEDDSVLKLIEQVRDNLYLPIKDNFLTYPLTLEEIKNPTVWELSHPQSKNKNHAKSIDTGCAFIALDGVTALMEFYKSKELEEMASIMVDRFSQVRLQECNVQTHATLSALRGTLRYYEYSNDQKGLDLAIKVFGDYKEQAWTEHYGNFNWWGKPRWTEPCAIVDSFIVASWLWRLTGEIQYLEDAQHIYHNAAATAQRATGAMGTDYCLGADLLKYEPYNEDQLDMRFVRPRTYEVDWCCTMRAGEFFNEAFRTSFFTDGNSVSLGFFNNCVADLKLDAGKVKIQEKTNYPYGGVFDFAILESDIRDDITLKIFIPSLWRGKDVVEVKLGDTTKSIKVENDCFAISFIPTKNLQLSFDVGIKSHTMGLINKENIHGDFSFRHGPMILAVDCDVEDIFNPVSTHEPIAKLARDTKLEYIGDGVWESKGDELKLSPLYNINRIPTATTARQALFTV